MSHTQEIAGFTLHARNARIPCMLNQNAFNFCVMTGSFHSKTLFLMSNVRLCHVSDFCKVLIRRVASLTIQCEGPGCQLTRLKSYPFKRDFVKSYRRLLILHCSKYFFLECYTCTWRQVPGQHSLQSDCTAQQ
jgi:hypothetical protein